jgi:hypothetical protein
VPFLLNILSYNPRIEHCTFVALEKGIIQYFDSKNKLLFYLIILLYIFEILYIFGGRFYLQPYEYAHDGA